MFRTVLTALALVLLLGFSVARAAQSLEACPDLAAEAINISAQVCDALGRNEACYGNSQVTVEPYAQNVPVTFQNPGDITPLGDIKSLLLTPMNMPDEWGIAMLNVQANLPDTLPGQNVRMVLIGNVYIENQVVPTQQLQVTAPNIVNLRSGPGTNFSQKGQLAAGDVVTVDGRTEDRMWLRIPVSTNEVAWVFAPLVTLDGDVYNLAVISPNTTVPTDFKPMQAFFVQTGIGDAKCREAAESGLLIQTPKGAGQINFMMNGIEFQVGSTVYVQAQAGGTMTIALLEGSTTVFAGGIPVPMLEGSEVTIPLDANGIASGPPEINSYNADAINALPLSLLPTAITVAPALTDEELTQSYPCNVLPQEAHVVGRVGPGENRGGLLELAPNGAFTVIGQALDENGDTWYRLDPASVSRNTTHENIWVGRQSIFAIGACRGVPEAEIPPIILSTAPGAGVVPLPGTWTMTVGKATSTGRCPYVTIETPLEETPCFGQLIRSFNRQWTVTVAEDGLSMVISGGFPYDGVTLTRVSPTRYSGDVPAVRYKISLTPVSETEMQGDISNFSITIPVTVQRQG